MTLYLQCAILGALLLAWSTAPCQGRQDSCPRAGASCPPNLRYRPIDGSCNNVQRPWLGSANTPLLRLLDPAYGDGAGAPRRSRSGKPLPSAQKIVGSLMVDVDHQYKTSHLFVIYGQLISNDFALIAAEKNQAKGPCCDKRVAERDSRCFPIPVPKTDPFYPQFNVDCLPMRRSNTTTCYTKRPEQITQVTHFLDASFVYGSDEDTNRRLREHNGGRLRSKIVVHGSGATHEFLPNKVDPAACMVKTSCYLTGDVRTNQSAMLAALQTLFLREHNRVAGILASLNPHWDDERIFQEARRIVVAEWQHITYAQWLPWLLGPDRVRDLGLKPVGATPHAQYNADLDPRTANDVTTGGYRSMHSMVQGHFWLGRIGTRNGSLGRLWNNPSLLETEDLEEHGMLDTLTGLMYQNAQAPDRWMDHEIGQQIEPIEERDGRRWGNDLAAVDIQRGRDHWLPGYNAYRKYVGLSELKNFSDLRATFNEEIVAALAQIYEHVDDIDYYVGGILERRKAFLLSPTFQPLLEDQFRRWRFADRFFYNFVGFHHSFTTQQIKAIQKASMGRLLCDNVRAFNFKKIPRDPFIQLGFNGDLKEKNSSWDMQGLGHWRHRHRSDGWSHRHRHGDWEDSHRRSHNN